MAKTSTAIVLGQDGTVREFDYQDGAYGPLQEAVGGHIESVSYWFKNIDAYVNEEGIYTPGLTVNPFGLAAFGQSWMGNIVIPRVTPTKRERITKMGIDLVNGIDPADAEPPADRFDLRSALASLGLL